MLRRLTRLARRQQVVTAAALAFGVVAWQQWLHRATGASHAGDPAGTSTLGHWLRDGALVFLPALGAVVLGTWLTRRLDEGRPTPAALLMRAATVAVVFTVALIPLVGLHGMVDEAISPAGIESIEAAPGAGYLGQGVSEGVWSELGHGLRDASLAAPAALMVMVLATGLTAVRPSRAGVVWGEAAPAVSSPQPAVAGPSALNPMLTKRELLKYSGAGAAALALSASGLVVLSTRRAHAAAHTGQAVPWLTDDIELFINDGTKHMIDGVPVYTWGWGFRTGGVDDSAALHTPGPVLWANHGDTVELTVTNTLDEAHSFFIDGVVDSGPIPPGQSRHVSFPAPPPGTYLYQDGVNRPVHRVLGLNGALVVMPADGSLRTHPSLDPAHWTFVTQWVWIFNDIDPAFNARAQANLPIDPDDFRARFKPRYFTLNGRTGSLAAHIETAPDTVVKDKLGNPALIRMVNAGLAMHGPHFHGNHVYPIVENGSVPSCIMWKDTIRVMPGDRIDVHLPFVIPPNAVHFPPPESGRRFLEELHGQDTEGTWPMHCHIEMSQSAGGGLYPQGLLTDWKADI